MWPKRRSRRTVARDAVSQEDNIDLEPTINGKPLKDFKQGGTPWSNTAWSYKKNEVKWKSLSHVWLFAIPWTIQSTEFSRPRKLEWIAFPFFRGSTQPRDPTQVSRMAGEFFTSWATRRRIQLKDDQKRQRFFAFFAKGFSYYRSWSTCFGVTWGTSPKQIHEPKLQPSMGKSLKLGNLQLVLDYYDNH